MKLRALSCRYCGCEANENSRLIIRVKRTIILYEQQLTVGRTDVDLCWQYGAVYVHVCVAR